MPGITNRDRAEFARRAVRVFAEETGTHIENLETQVCDLLANLMHLCAEESIGWEQVSTMSEIHFNEEQAEEEA